MYYKTSYYVQNIYIYKQILIFIYKSISPYIYAIAIAILFIYSIIKYVTN